MKSGSDKTLTCQSFGINVSKSVKRSDLDKLGIKNCTLLTEEIDAAKNNSKVIRVENIIEKFPFKNNDELFINPCYGDPEDRDVLGGGFLTEEAFVKPNEFLNFKDFSFQKAGPRLQVALKSEEVHAAITLGGALCPGLNVAVRELVMCLWFNYGVRSIWGIRFGLNGCVDEKDWIKLTPDEVSNIHMEGGSILGSNRGSDFCTHPQAILDMIVKKDINALFMIGGIGSHHEMNTLKGLIEKNNLKISTCCIPKTIDNDIPLIDRSFGFETSVEETVKVISTTNLEASCSPNGIAIIKIFGRESGFTALHATNGSRDVNICLLPEQKFNLYGEYGLIEYVFKRLKLRDHCVILVSEGTAFSILDKNLEGIDTKDSYGNKIYPDVGKALEKELNEYANKNNLDVNIKYIDPTYIIRAHVANSFDTAYATKIAQNAVHCIFAGFTNFSPGFIERHPVIIPIDHIVKVGKRKIDVNSDNEYRCMMASTGQPSFNFSNTRLTKSSHSTVV